MANYYINYLNSGIGGVTYCDLKESSLSLNYSGGSFNIVSENPLGSSAAYQDNLGRQLTIFGFLGTVTDFGRIRELNNNSYSTEGIFSTTNMNKPFSIVTFGSIQHLQFLGSVQLYAVPQPNTYTTVSGMARAIAAIAGVNLAWTVPDAPYKDVLGQSTQTAIEALGSLAGQVGATLRWNGNLNYTVAYPNFTAGLWVVPNAALITGYRYTYHKDLGLGVSGIGSLGIPINTYFDPATKTIPDTKTGGGIVTQNVEVAGSTTKPLSISDPPIPVEMPNDVSEVKAQILVNQFDENGAVIPTAFQYGTHDAATWFTFKGTTRLEKRGNAHRRFAYISYGDMPASNPIIQNGRFTFSIGYVRTSFQGIFDDGKEEATQTIRDIMAKMNANNRFIKTFSASLSCIFFGSIPLPGMTARFTYCGETVEGIVESVSLSKGILTVELAQYFRIDFLDKKLQWDLEHTVS